MFRIQNLTKSVVAVPAVSPCEICKQVREFLAQHGWRETNRPIDTEGCTISATNPQAGLGEFLSSRNPQSLEIEVSKDDMGVIVQSEFYLSRAFNQFMQAGFVCSSLFCLLGMLMRFRGLHEGAYVSAVGLVPWSFILVLLNDTSKYSHILNGIHGHLSHWRGENVLVLRDIVVWPPARTIHSPMGIVWILCAGLFLIGAPDFNLIRQPMILLLLAIMAVAIVALFAVLTRSAQHHHDLDGFMPAFAVGKFIAMFPFIPFFLFVSFDGHNATSVGLWGLVLIVIVVALFCMESDIFLQELAKLQARSQFITQLAEPESQHLALVTVIFAIWLGCAALTLFATYLSISGLEIAITGKSAIFTSGLMDIFAQVYGRVGVALFSLPVLVLVGMLCLRNVRRRHELLNLPAATGDVLAITERLSRLAEINLPGVLLDSDKIATCSAVHVVWRGTFVRMTVGLVEALNAEELAAVLAHEIFHIRNHTTLFLTLDVLSEFSLFGTGFLALALNSRKLEFDADRFAIDLLRKAQLPEQKLASALRKISIWNEDQRTRRGSYSRLGISCGNAEQIPENLTVKEKVSWLFSFYFGDAILSYVHPSLKERLKRIEAQS